MFLGLLVLELELLLNTELSMQRLTDLPGHICLTAHTPSLQHKDWFSPFDFFTTADAQVIVPTDPASSVQSPEVSLFYTVY